MKNILVFGSGGHAKVVIDIIEKEKKYNIKGLVNNFNKHNEEILGYRIIGDDSSIDNLVKKYEIFGGIIAIADNFKRLEMRDKIIKKIPSFKFVNCFHPNSVIGKDVNFGEGSVVMAGAIINSCSSILDNCIINTNSSIDHDCIMRDFSSIAPNATIGGGVVVGAYSFVGIGANVLHNIIVEENCIIGGGSVVCENTIQDSIYFGSPAKFSRNHKLGEKYL
jgi:sugar O-acyltransferase (sialic acid O-acetyltransferase NeuD family)